MSTATRTRTQSAAQQHSTWISLMDVSGAFLSQVVLGKYFAQGLPKAENESQVRRELGQAYEEWLNNRESLQLESAMHQTWLRFVLTEVLEFVPETLLSGQAIPETLSRALPEERETLRPDVVVQSPYEGGPRLLVQFYEKRQDLQKVVPERHWKASPATRMAELLRYTGIRLGLVTNGEQWMLVDAPRDETTGYYTWEAALWSEEPLTLRAFRALLGMERFFSVAQDERLEALLAESREKQEEVTTQLGTQVRLAVGTLVRTLDRLDKDSQRTLLREMSEKEVYNAALTVMMRLVFLLCAEEREMLLLGDELYDANYAISTMYKQLQEQADQQGEEVLGLRHDAWSRLLATFRVVYGGVEYLDMRLPAYGGHLFDPDRFPFLEGREPGTSWLDTPAEPLLIDNRTVLHLLRALQFLQGGNGRKEARRQSFRALDIEQIGHVYEGLLDYTARRAHEPILGLEGSEKQPEPEVSLHELEEARSKGQARLLALLAERTGRSASALEKALTRKLDGRALDQVSSTSGEALAPRVLPFAGLLRRDTFGEFLVIPAGSLYTAPGGERRNTGTHYTPRSLTEP
ncbi:MAG TPA: restriction endonuclease, partial [Ktedonobacteraceae bacterium]|nr:restriction endonuclease [Ktedonobacteraceae bacterium]